MASDLCCARCHDGYVGLDQIDVKVAWQNHVAEKGRVVLINISAAANFSGEASKFPGFEQDAASNRGKIFAVIALSRAIEIVSHFESVRPSD